MHESPPKLSHATATFTHAQNITSVTNLKEFNLSCGSDEVQLSLHSTQLRPMPPPNAIYTSLSTMHASDAQISIPISRDPPILLAPHEIDHQVKDSSMKSTTPCSCTSLAASLTLSARPPGPHTVTHIAPTCTLTSLLRMSLMFGRPGNI